MNALNETNKGVDGWKPEMEKLGLKRGYKTTLPSGDIVDYPFMEWLPKFTEALGPPIQLERIFELVQQEMERSPLRVEFDPISRTPRYNNLFMATLFPALPFFAEGRIIRCEQCNKLMLARGETKRFCSPTCRYKAFPKRPYNPNNESVKHLRKWYQKLRVRGGMTLDEFRKVYKTILENEKKEEIKHGKKTKSK